MEQSEHWSWESRRLAPALARCVLLWKDAQTQEGDFADNQTWQNPYMLISVSEACDCDSSGQRSVTGVQGAVWRQLSTSSLPSGSIPFPHLPGDLTSGFRFIMPQWA